MTLIEYSNKIEASLTRNNTWTVILIILDINDSWRQNLKERNLFYYLIRMSIFLFSFQCETCLCWSHCECVGVTATCIPAFFKCSICTKAEGKNYAFAFPKIISLISHSWTYTTMVSFIDIRWWNYRTIFNNIK